MRTVKNKIFEGMFQSSVVEYDGNNSYNFYNLEDDFYFTYNVEDYQFTEKCDANLSQSQINKVEAKIMSFHNEREYDKRQEMESTDYQDMQFTYESLGQYSI